MTLGEFAVREVAGIKQLKNPCLLASIVWSAGIRRTNLNSIRTDKKRLSDCQILEQPRAKRTLPALLWQQLSEFAIPIL